LTTTRRAIEPHWPAPANVLALCTTRQGGRSAPPFESFNLAHHVGDSPGAVLANRATLVAELPAGSEISWLEQVHGTAVIEARAEAQPPVADAQWSRRRGVACAVMTADCLPVLFCSAAGDVVAAAHAGWRGLLAGVLEATVVAMATPADGVLAWLGPAIGPDAFEVGPEVRAAFLAAAGPSGVQRVAACFTPSAGREDHWFADLYALARTRLASLGVTGIFGGGYCTHSDDSRFFSFRRDGQTGRMASVILLR
jgi:YfiH family protein